MYVFGGRNEEQEFNDLKIMRLINPSERQPGKTVTQLRSYKDIQTKERIQITIF